MSVAYAMPAPPMRDGELGTTRWEVAESLTWGRLGSCCVCSGTCFTWWSPAPPSGYTPVHEGCAGRLVERWKAMISDGDTEPEKLFVPPSGARTGAYARLSAQAPEGIAPVRAAAAATLPDGFTPGPYWLPGDDEHTPWMVLLETASGHTICPAGPNRTHAETVYGQYKIRPETSSRTAIVGAALIGPGGEVVQSWGSVPTPDAPRWASLVVVGMWQRCAECGELRWPGSWVTVEGARCPDCQALRETDDPRPWPPEATRPKSDPPELKAKKVTAPASARKLGRRDGFTSRRK